LNSRKILIVSDAWEPQVSGVVTTLNNTIRELEKMGHSIKVFSPQDCRIQFPLPLYSEIKLGIPSRRKIKEAIEWDPHHIHISTPEGPIGRAFCRRLDRMKIRYTTAYHTKFPEFVKRKLRFVPLWLSHIFMRYVNRKSTAIMVPTPSMVEELTSLGYKCVRLWGRGYDEDVFKPDLIQKKEPVFVCVSRVSLEKSLEDFFELDLPGRKIMVGDGPDRKMYEKKYKDVEFVGYKKGKELAQYYRDASVFVFPSKLDTFGVVMIESIACGTPIAAYNVTGPKDIVENGINGYIGDDLWINAINCLKLDRKEVCQSSHKYTWKSATMQFLNNLENIKEEHEDNSRLRRFTL